jgi:hypothetical protein
VGLAKRGVIMTKIDTRIERKSNDLHRCVVASRTKDEDSGYETVQVDQNLITSEIQVLE